MAEWISVKERLPEGYEPFLAVSKWGNISISKRRSWGDSDWLVGGMRISKDVVAWMPLPDPPKEDVK